MVEGGKALHEMRVYDEGALSLFILDLRTRGTDDGTEKEKVRRTKLKTKMEKLARAKQ